MLRSAASKVMWVGRATVFLIGLAVILALVFGVASTVSAHTGNKGFFHLGHKNVSNALSTLVKQGPGPALNLMVQSGQPPLKVNSSGKVANLNSDKLDGLDQSAFLRKTGKATDSDKLDGKNSDEILPLVRAQRDNNPSFTSFIQNGSSAQTNTVSITAPTDGFFVISSSVDITHYSGTDTQKFTVSTKLDGTNVSAARLEISPNTAENVSPHTTVPVSSGEHTITLEANRFVGTGSWIFNRNNLSVMFIPASRGGMTEVPDGG